ncbi:Protein CBG17664 [Caenorhabditis briggsae]|uniref:Protein CBG17664 n=1 Tax=Caenorhabditis briggsae TaxID=6238 RepID=A8XRK6_CAEBR|nr:Protein CBG17664 [Caenorhabditis briggsae]CAP35280.1 Protein CBG17664 [Caenorhabditis briggsae]
MLPLPWWILGVGPDEADDEQLIEPEKTPENPEIPEPSTPSSLVFRTPSASPEFLAEAQDHLPKVVDMNTFMNVAKKRSSSRMDDWVSPKVRKTNEKKSFVRNETEIMNKTLDEEPDGIPLNSEDSSRSGSPMPFNNDVFNDTFFLDDNNNQMAQNETVVESPSRERDFPLFFTSFDDTTVLFNTTITGDIDLSQKNDAVGDWVFKNNQFLQSPDLKTDGAGDAVFKQPKQGNGSGEEGNKEKETKKEKEKKKELEKKKHDDDDELEQDVEKDVQCQEIRSWPENSKNEVATEKSQKFNPFDTNESSIVEQKTNSIEKGEDVQKPQRVILSYCAIPSN